MQFKKDVTDIVKNNVQDLLQKYDLGPLLGRGAFGAVF